MTESKYSLRIFKKNSAMHVSSQIDQKSTKAPQTKIIVLE